jgi:hypothetical protein
MYCSNCGSQIKPELNYCSRCGTKVAKNDAENSSMAENLSAALGYIGGFGLIGFIFVALVLVKNGVPANALAAISFFYLATLFGICFLILRQTANFSGKTSAKNKDFHNNFQAEQLGAATTAQLDAPREPVASVTEKTTRTLDEVLVERK